MEDSYDSLIEDGFEYLVNGELEAAMLKFQRAECFAPEDAVPHYYAGIIYLELKRWGEALKELEAAAHFDPDNVYVYLSLARAHGENGNADAQREVLEIASHLPGEPGILHLASGHLASARGTALEALRQYRFAHECSVDGYNTLGLIGYALLRLQRDEDAREVLQRATCSGFVDASDFYNLGLAEERLRNYKGAYEAYLSATQAKPRYASALAKLGKMERRLGKWRSAWHHWKQTFEINYADLKQGKNGNV